MRQERVIDYAYLNMFASSGFRLKSEQEVTVRALVEWGKDVLAVLPTRYIEVMARSTASPFKILFVHT